MTCLHMNPVIYTLNICSVDHMEEVFIPASAYTISHSVKVKLVSAYASYICHTRNNADGIK